MNKKIISFVLCLTLLFGNLLPIASAEEGNILSTDDVFVENTESVTEPAETEAVTQPSGTEAVTEPVVTTVPAETVSETQPEPTETDEQDAPAFGAPACDCGSQSALIIGHSDVCAMKQFYKDLCAGTASDVYALWNEIPKNAQAYIMTYLGYQNPAALKELVFLLASKWESESGLSGVAAAIKDGTLFGAFGIPEDAVLQIKEAAAEAKAAIEAFVAQQKNAGKELFTWDISVLNGEGISWQPDGSVRVELELPDIDLHKNTKVFVVHVDDEGNAEKIEAEVIDGNKIAFDTKGFSTFAAYTVDFEYNGVPFSIPGGSEIMLSKLMDQLKMDFDVTDVANVEFTNYELVSLEKQGSDWLLTSLQAFQTEEKLTLTLTDGRVYEIKVTDAITYPSIYWRTTTNCDDGSDGSEEWRLYDFKNDDYADLDGAAGSHTENYDIVVDGTDATNENFEIVLQRRLGYTGRTLYLDLHTIWVKGGANLTIRLGSSINNGNTDKVVIRQVPGHANNGDYDDWWLGELFWIESGSFEIRPSYDNQSDVRIQIDVHPDVNTGSTYGNSKAYVSLRNDATSFKADQCDFVNNHTRAIAVRANNLSEFTLTDCNFGLMDSNGKITGICYNEDTNGGAIYVERTASDDTSIVDINKMTLTNVNFYGSWVEVATTDSKTGETEYSGYGGAIAIRGRITNQLLLENCTFMNTNAYSHGGAISISNGDSATTVGSVKFLNCEFIGTEAKNARGGAVRMVFSGATPVTIEGCIFKGCTAYSHGGAIANTGTVGSFTIQSSEKQASQFLNCSAGARGGAVGVSCASIGNITLSNAIFSGNTADTLGGALHFGLDGAIHENGTPQDYSDDYLNAGPVDGGAVSVTGCTFTNNYSKGGIGGGICFTDGSYDSVSFTSTSFTDCYSANFGGAIALKAYAEDRVNLLPFSVDGDVTIEKCTFTRCGSGGLYPESWDHDGNPNTAKVTTWDHDGDPNTAEILRLNGTGGGGAICIGGVIGGKISITGESESKPSKFINCYTWNNGGAISLLGHVKTDEAVLQYLEMDGCRARDAGNAIHLSELKIADFDFLNCVVKNCNYFTEDFDDQKWTETSTKFYLPDVARNDTYYKQLGDDTFAAYDAGGTFRCIGNTSCSAMIQKCTFTNNHSYCNGGAVYWNANTYTWNAAKTEILITPELTIDQTTFTGNTAIYDGGALYCEATVTITGVTEFSENTAYNRGGAIAQQVYNNRDARMLGDSGGDEATNLVLSSSTTIDNNTAYQHGGGISITVSNSTSIPDDISNFRYPVKFQLGGATVSNNKAYGNGGGIYYATTHYESDGAIQARVDCFQKEINIDSGNIFSNTSGYGATAAAEHHDGGGIYMDSYQANKTGYSKVTVSDGSIYKNTANHGDGGGIYITGKNSEIIITGGTIGGSTANANKATRSGGNTASGRGGGIAVSGGATLKMQGGTDGESGSITYNEAQFQGGGIWLSTGFNNAMTLDKGIVNYNKVVTSYHTAANGGGVYVGGTSGSARSTFTMTGGEVAYNETPAWGGGLYGGGYAALEMKQREGETQGGKVYQNKASMGGGVCLQDNATMTIKHGSVYENEATGNGGGGILGTGSASKITVEGGSIYSNTANYGNGGGLLLLDAADADIKGGSIYENTARDNGGGIYSSGTTGGSPSCVNVVGGSIHENKVTGTSGGGGGICAVGKCVINVKQSDDGKTVGTITKNEAPNGGGIYLTGGADLTVNNGFVTFNKAVGKPSNMTTTYHENAKLLGTGGGIYVADGRTDTTFGATTFTLQGTNIAIYGNLADFAADDVFANGVNTDLEVPPVVDMNLSGYDAKPKGWFEDYPKNDTSYLGSTEANVDDSLELGTPIGITNGNVWRYRGAPANKRVVIPGQTVSALKANNANTYVCMTLGAPVAVGDSVVIDYGLDIMIHVLQNDLLIGADTTSVIRGVGYNYSGESSVKIPDGKTGDAYAAELGFGSRLTHELMAGRARSFNRYVDYQVRSMIMDSEDVFTYAVEFDGYLYFANVKVIPATTIYYEDNCTHSITYSAYTYDVSTKTKIQDLDAAQEWDELDDGTISDYYQDEDRPGVDVDNALNDLDMDSVYGYDSGYASYQRFSLAGARKFTSNQTGNVRKVGEAKFTFKGTGFDVISLTSNATGTITVQVFALNDEGKRVTDNKGNVVAAYTSVVDTYYGYSYENGKWVVSANPSDTSGTVDTNTLYQVPVVKVKNLTYGKYEAVITVSYLSFFDHANADKKNEYDFYLDAIRIYDPANDGTGNQVIQDAYVADNEGWPEYLELRNLLLSRSDFDNSKVSETDVSGILFIDGRGNISEDTTTPDENGKDQVTGVSDYMNYGPNNELYLTPGQSIAFNFTLGTALNAKVASVQIGLKSVGGNAKVTCFGYGSAGYDILMFNQKEINSATDMYYDITPLLGRDIVITNSGVTGNAILSITNIKVTYKEAHSDFIEKGYFPKATAMATFALRSINRYYADLQAQMSVDLIGATLSFEDEVYTNLYYTTTNLDGAAESNMGLLTWSTMPEDATFENAENVFEGAVYNADNGRYMVRTDGIASKNLGDDIYMRPYVKLSTGSYAYGDLITYSPKQYAMSRLENSSNESLKALCVAMLNYGAAAQKYFGYKADDLMNADLTEEQQALVSEYSANLFRGAIGANATKIGEFAKTKTGFSAGYASVSFESAFAINYYFTPNAAVDGDVTLYYWTAEDYASAKTLTADNASGALTMVSDDSGNYWAQISGIAAKQLDDTYYVAAVYTSNGETFCTGVIAYSLSAYCMRNANGNMGELAQATAMYGYYAMNYFG